ncbi:hypothetical protein BCR37DRAFT_392668 [Protomyces lactucae-debilis]|uniref:Metal homeostatis protein bsd2 n=1 Tax=Protomyces lactucae-debilis TaxID=2754530 RepID=A0A1Y2FEU6_PROLT|nr:uncharacterized protein BCR37DRAFT_392668 [Protomyces lactucae-debilis]ORY82449.1 hypothetical protein BCR37DRAFT_392668 [Protomyces lactucae-debilis]
MRYAPLQADDEASQHDENQSLCGNSAGDDLASSFDAPEDATAADERLRLIEPTPAQFGVAVGTTPSQQRRIIHISGNDGVFTNISAKPTVELEKEEHPPTYEQASSDNAPPYWETTMYMLGASDEIFIDGLAVGHIFGFVWNMLVSVSFQFIGFLLTYVLHTTHAAKYGSRAGFGATLIQYGFYLRAPEVPSDNSGLSEDTRGGRSSIRDALGRHTDYAAYAMLAVGWLLLIKSTADFLKVRRMEACVRETSTSDGSTAVVAHNETPQTAV